MPYYNVNAPFGMIRYIVTQPARNIKALAKAALKGRWLAAMGAAVLVELMVSGPSLLLSYLFKGEFTSFISDLYYIVISGPATLGLVLYYLKIFRMQSTDGVLFSPFRNRQLFFRGLLLYCGMMLRIMLWSLLFIVPGIIAAIRYSQAFKVLADHPEYSPGACLFASDILMKGNKLRFFLLRLSFIAWYFVVALPRIFAVNAAMRALPDVDAMLTDINIFSEFYATISRHPLTLLSLFLAILLGVYIQLSECCFYDLAAGNLRIESESDWMEAAENDTRQNEPAWSESGEIEAERKENEENNTEENIRYGE
ncbi:MAG TPA: DUF975 family protein [Bacillota bacterium]|nr:DUF975 family protein [Bacillota bacterium]HQC35476.1 DUF975 family protein [Bacillota bacterium]